MRSLTRLTLAAALAGCGTTGPAAPTDTLRLIVVTDAADQPATRVAAAAQAALDGSLLPAVRAVQV